MWEQLSQWFLEPDNQKLCLSIVIAFIIGSIAGRLIRHGTEEKLKPIDTESEKAFFKGVQYILSNDHDQAIEEFAKSVQVNSDTIETYVALGNLYRSRGDIDRAIRIRQNIILRPSIDEQIKINALFDLGLDYRKGGFINRALETFLKVLQKEPSNIETLEEVEKIYEEMKDWPNAFASRQRIIRLTGVDHRHILAHHQTEIGKSFEEKGDSFGAKSCYKKAISIHENCLDAYLHLGDLYFDKQEYKKAIATWKEVVRVAPNFTFLAYRRLEGAYSRMKDPQPMEIFLRECAQLNSDAFTHLALARYLANEQDYNGALRELEAALSLDPYFWKARKYMGEILLENRMKDEALDAYKDLISHLNVPYLTFRCTNCGFIPTKLQWQCPSCKKWDTMNFMDSGIVYPASLQQIQEPISTSPQKDSEEEG